MNTAPNRLPFIVGLCGYAGSGKDEAAIALTNLGWKRLAFADPVRAMLLAVDPLVPVELESPLVSTTCGPIRLSLLVEIVGWDEAKRQPEVRRLLQRLGTEGARECLWPSIWIDRLAMELPPSGGVVITDVRFPEEADFIHDRGGAILRIVREGVGPVNDHTSDRISFRADVVIENHRTVADLHYRVLESVLQVLGRRTSPPVPEAASV